jgi:hypothetical protein
MGRAFAVSKGPLEGAVAREVKERVRLDLRQVSGLAGRPVDVIFDERVDRYAPRLDDVVEELVRRELDGHLTRSITFECEVEALESTAGELLDASREHLPARKTLSERVGAAEEERVLGGSHSRRCVDPTASTMRATLGHGGIPACFRHLLSYASI